MGEGNEAVSQRRYVKVPLRAAIGGAVLVVVLVVGYGLVHITCNDESNGIGVGICQKESWGLGDTFVNLDDYVGKPLIEMLPKAHVLRAMFACGKLERPAFLDEPRQEPEPPPGYRSKISKECMNDPLGPNCQP